MEEKSILNQHSALVTHNIKKGKYYTLTVEKSIFALLLRAQQDLKNNFKEKFAETFSGIMEKKDISEVIDYLFSGKENLIENKEFKREALIEKFLEVVEKQEENIKKLTSNPVEREQLRKDFGLELNIKKIGSKENLSQKEISEMFLKIKEHCKESVVRDYLDSRTINFTTLSNAIGAHSTKLKTDLTNAMDTVLEFNYINRKNLNIDVVTSMLASIRFTKSKKITWFTYQIPKEILELLLMPEVYVPLEGIVIGKLSGVYTIRMYALLRDHIKRGEIELSKEELFNFFTLPSSYGNKTNLINKFLEPTLKEVKEASGIETTYEFFPKHSYERIKFYPVQKRIPKITVNPVVDYDEDINVEDTEGIQKYLEKAKRNIFVSKAWNKRVENKIKKIQIENGEEVAIYILKALYTDLKKEISSTLVQYISGILKNYYNSESDSDSIGKKKVLPIAEEKQEKIRKSQECDSKEKKIQNIVKESEINSDHLMESVMRQKNSSDLQNKKVVSADKFEEIMKQFIIGGMDRALAIKFMNIRYIIGEE